MLVHIHELQIPRAKVENSVRCGLGGAVFVPGRGPVCIPTSELVLEMEERTAEFAVRTPPLRHDASKLDFCMPGSLVGRVQTPCQKLSQYPRVRIAHQRQPSATSSASGDVRPAVCLEEAGVGLPAQRAQVQGRCARWAAPATPVSALSRAMPRRVKRSAPSRGLLDPLQPRDDGTDNSPWRASRGRRDRDEGPAQGLLMLMATAPLA
mmetsp:Transcript_13135/g.38619  ORF Transcript_13135/g.38619 Transcript_13135/m.38619 type:complete len:208 (-) Transcript_13135:618-1241(-)